MQEQLRHKQKFNLVAFDSKAECWKGALTEVTERNLQSAWQWVKALDCKGSTNTLAALRVALADPNTEAVYLLTDGRPDQVSHRTKTPKPCLSFSQGFRQLRSRIRLPAPNNCCFLVARIYACHDDNSLLNVVIAQRFVRD